VICEIMNEDGTMSRLPDLVGFAQKHGLKIGTISDLIAYRRRHDNLVKVRSEEVIQSEFGGDWTLRIYTDETQGAEHIVLIKGDITGPDAPVLVRMHALDPLKDMVGTGPKGRAFEFTNSMQTIADEGRGVLVLLRDTHMKLATGRRGQPADPAPIRAWRADPVLPGVVATGAFDQFANAQDCRAGGVWAGNHRHPQDHGRALIWPDMRRITSCRARNLTSR
jgi:hypothetical protein